MCGFFWICLICFKFFVEPMRPTFRWQSVHPLVALFMMMRPGPETPVCKHLCLFWFSFFGYDRLFILRGLSSFRVPMARHRPLHWQPKAFAYRRLSIVAPSWLPCAFSLSSSCPSCGLLCSRMPSSSSSAGSLGVDNETPVHHIAPQFFVRQR